MTYEQIAYEVDGGIATVTLDRPDRMNAFTVTMAAELLDVFDRIDADDEVRVVVVTGRGRAFCAGADLADGAEALDMSKSPAGVDRERDLGGIVALRIFACLKPVIGALNGSAAGVGITLTLPMDVRVLADHAKVAFGFTGRGIVPDAASSWFLPRIVGLPTALEWCLTARTLTADEALAGGVVRSVHPADEVLPVAQRLATEMAERSAPVSAALTRHMLWRLSAQPSPIAAHRLDSRLIAHTSERADAYEGITAFLEKRPAQWSLAVSADLPDDFPWWGDEPFRPDVQ
ncbi:MAG TPA: enoyl-CoA hydratase-related protein [Acidimicrobiales bacterium]|nr:enoyl-CoA hydratase-related protein [Acidimicrobiales bacterium]